MKDKFRVHRGKNGIVYYSIPAFDETRLVKSCFTTRIGGVSKGEYDSLNLGFKTEDDRESILENFKLISKELNLPLDHFVYSDQIHGDKIKIITEEDRGKGFNKESDIIGIDAFITNVKNIVLTTVYADCVPIFLLDPKQQVISLVHAGWRGTVLKIGAKAVEKMTKEFGTNPKDCLAAIGPSIGKCCFEVDNSVVDEFNKSFTNHDSFIFSKGNGKYMVDLWQTNKLSLEEIGVLPKNITISDLCTKCDTKTFFSYRGENGLTGRMAAIMSLI